MNVKGILWVEPLGIWGTLRSRPEWIALRVNMILGEDMKKVKDLVIEEGLEVFSSNINTG